MRNPLIRLPLTLLLLWLSWLGVSQWLNARDDDWSDDYVESTATIVNSRADYWSSPDTEGLWTCRLIVEWTYQNKTYREEPIWLKESTARGYSQMDDDCGESRFGDTVPVWIAGTEAAEPFILEPGNRSSQPLTGIVSLLQAALFLGLAALLWRRPQRSDPAGSDSA